MKILFVQKEGGIFGAENYHLKVIPGLLSKGVEIEFLRLYTKHQGGKGGAFIDRLGDLGVKTFEVNIGKYPTPKVLNQIKRVANNGDFDIVHTHLIHADFHLALIKVFMRLSPVLVSTKHGYDNTFTSKFGFNADKQTKTPYYLISRWAEKRMKASYTISKALRDFFIEIGLSGADKMSLIRYGFDMPENFTLKGKEGFRTSEKQIIIAGRLVAFKGHEYLLRALPKVIEAFGGQVKLLIAGTGKEEQRLKETVKELEIEKNVLFLGYSKEVGAYMANSDVVVVPSISEGFGVVFLEAFAAKTPVVAWDVSAGNELIQDGETGHLVKPYDINALSDRLIQVLTTKEEQQKITDLAYDELKNKYSLSRMLKETIDFYNKSVISN